MLYLIKPKINFKMAPETPSEEILGRKWDRCLANTVIKIGRESIVLSYFFIHE